MVVWQFNKVKRFLLQSLVFMVRHLSELYTDRVTAHLPPMTTKLDQAKDAQSRDDTDASETSSKRGGQWHKMLPPYWPQRSDWHEGEELLMKGDRLVFPDHMRQDVLQKIHQGHQGINKCLSRARESVWRPGITPQIKQMVERCEAFAVEIPTPV